MLRVFVVLTQIVTFILGMTQPSSAGLIELAVDGAPTGIDRRSGTCTAFRFDLSSLSGQAIERAIVELEIPNLAQDTFDFEILEMNSDWVSGTRTSVSDEKIVKIPSGAWRVTPMDLERDPAGRIRFDVTILAREWISGVRTNHGLAIVSARVSPQLLESGLSHARLQIHYRRGD